jgi:hypothetical protein
MDAQARLRLENRFWSKVNRGLQSECWEWNRSVHVKWGYGQFRWINPANGRNEVARASRVAFWLVFGYFPEMVCHTCDNPPCCNPAHLYAGDAATNGADKAARNRARGNRNQSGEHNKVAVLTDAMVIEARRRVHEGESRTDVATDLGVLRPTLSYAVSGKTWTHLNDIAPPVVHHRWTKAEPTT